MASNAPNIINKTKYVDIANAESRARESAKIAFERMAAKKQKVKIFGEADRRELERLEGLVDLAINNDGYLDPLFAALRYALLRNDGNLKPVRIENDDGALTFYVEDSSTKSGWKKLGDPEFNVQATRTSLLYGLLKERRAPTPRVLPGKDGTDPDTKDPNLDRFMKAFYEALGTASSKVELAQKVLSFQMENLRIGGSSPNVFSGQIAKTVERLAKKGVQEDDPRLRVLAESVLKEGEDLSDREDDKKPWHEIAIDLPDLNQSLDTNVVAENVYLMGPMIFASMFEELKAFQVVDKLVEMSQRGHLSLGRGKAGTRLYQYWREAPNRMSEVERQTFYAMTLGMPTGQPGAQVNVEFQDLWLRFVSSVSELIRESRVEALIRSEQPLGINQQQVKKAARDLVSNMSLHGYGMAYYAAVDLQKQINEMIKLLSDEELRASFGARDMWGVIDQIAQVELGGARNSSKYRTLATSGAIITRWLGDNLHRTNDPTLPMVDMREIDHPPARLANETATTDPTDYDLINACELWLADSALDDLRVEELSQPRESPQQPSRPIQMPSIARDLLEGTGLGLGMGHGQQPQAVNGHDRRAYAGY